MPVAFVTPASHAPVDVLLSKWDPQVCPDGNSWYAIVGGKPVPQIERNACNKPGARTELSIRRQLQKECSIPYFGETSSFVYLGAIRSVWQKADGTCQFGSGALVELRREDVRLSFLKEKGNLYPSRTRPLHAAWAAVASELDLPRRPSYREVWAEMRSFLSTDLIPEHP